MSHGFPLGEVGLRQDAAARLALARVITPRAVLRATRTTPGGRRTRRRGRSARSGPGLQRRRVGGREQDVGAGCLISRGSTSCSHTVPVSAGRDASRSVSGAQPAAAVLLGRAEDELVRGRAGQLRPGREDLRQVAADAGRLADELARIDRDSHLGQRARSTSDGVAVGLCQPGGRAVPGEGLGPLEARARQVARPRLVSQSRDRWPMPIRPRRSGSRRIPPVPTTSGKEPRFDATTGTPADIASRAGRPKPRRATAAPARARRRTALRGARRRRSRRTRRVLERRLRRCARATRSASGVALPAMTSRGVGRGVSQSS